ncbi:SDR family oxidoreductase [Alcaligenaceae bacterium B3P038]|nr:SDR family oxidoreductase [Alcaligenaceae bacterium B3P038]
MDVRLDGRVALITGGSTGLGLATAKEFVTSGADVAIVARRSDVLDMARRSLEALGRGRIHAISADISTMAGVTEAYESTVRTLGKIDVLVNNAGKSETGSFVNITDETWQSEFDLKVFAAIRLARLVIPSMKEARWGRIINVLNTASKAPRAGCAPTSISRAAGLALTKVLASELAPDSILVNALLVGLIDSDPWVRKHQRDSADHTYEEFLNGMATSVPMGRVGTASKFARVACFLASDANGYVTGAAINVDGGSPVG